MEILDQLSAHVSLRKSSAGKSRTPLSASQDQPAMTNGSQTPLTADRPSRSSTRPTSASASAALQLQSQKPAEKAEDGRISRQTSLAKASAEDILTQRPSLKREAEPQSGQRDAIGDKRANALPAVPSRLLSERANGIGRAESGELPQDAGSIGAPGGSLFKDSQQCLMHVE